MTSNLNTNQPAPSPGPWLEKMVRKPRETAYVFFGAAGLLALIPIFFLLKYKWEYLSVSLWGAMLALLTGAAGVWQLRRQSEGTQRDVDAARLLLLFVGGLAGFATVLLSLMLTKQWWDDYFAGGLESWRKEWWRVFLCLFALFAGLVVMFTSLQLARADERSNPSLRRLLYGYNSVLTGLLLVAILTVLNVLTYVRLKPFTFFSVPGDWTASSIYTLSPASKNLLADLKMPVKVYVIMSSRDFVANEVRNLMDNIRNANDKVEVEYISPENNSKMGELRKKYSITEGEGILLVYGIEPKEEHEFIKPDELVDLTTGGKKFLFIGENAFVTKLSFLAEGKSRTVVYFTQGNGEPDLNESTTTRRDQGLGVLKDRLEKGNYDAKPLKLDANTTQIPEDASVVVIARPTLPIAPEALKALDAYLTPVGEGKKKGKLIALLDVAVGPDKNMVVTGLEEFLAKYNVQVQADRMLSPQTRDPLLVLATPNPNAQNPIADAFQGMAFPFYDVRSIQTKPSPPGRPGMSPFNAEVLLYAVQVWGDKNLTGNPLDIVKNLRQAKVETNIMPLAVMVTRPGDANPMDPHAGLKRDPVLVVFGDGTMVTNQNMQEGSRTGHYELFSSVLSWVRERADIGKKADPKERKAFVLRVKPDVVSRLFWLPGFFMLLAIIGLGGGIWVVRRR